MQKYKLVFFLLTFLLPSVSFAATGATFTPASGGESISASTAGSGGDGTFTLLSGPIISEGAIGNIKSGTITLTAPSGFEFDTTSSATVTVTSTTTNSNTNINHLPSGTIAPTITTSNTISFKVNSQSTSARNTLTWNSVRIRPTSASPVASGQILLSSTGVIQNLTLPMDAGTVTEIPLPPVSPTFTEVKDNITEDTTWALVDSPYYIPSSISVDDGATLTIEPGVVVKFGAMANLYINGVLNATGTSSDHIVFTSYKDDSAGGDTNNDTASTTPADSDWRGVSFNNPDAESTISNIELRYADYGFGNFGSSINISDSEFSHINSGIISFTGGSSILRNITFKNVAQYAVALYEGSQLDGEGISIYNLDDYADGIDLFEGSSIVLKNSSLKGSLGSYSMLVFEGSDIDMDAVSISNFDVGIADFGDGSGDPDILNIQNSEIKNNDIGFLLFADDTEFNVLKNSISDNISYGVKSFSKGFINFKNNFWGDESGPYNESLNPLGLGNITYSSAGYSKIIFKPWLTAWPSDVVEDKTCCSSVLFFPGIEGSRLYKESFFGVEDQLWEANTPSDVEDLYMDEEGNSINDVYTKDIIRETNLAGGLKIFRKKIYKSLSDDLDSLKTEGKIADWAPVAYDWRLGIDDIVDDGIVEIEGNAISAIEEVENMAMNSQTGRVTLVGHSNGGLFIKYLVKKLAEKGEASLVDKIILVGSPEIGTPKGVIAILHGLSFGVPFSIAAPQKYNRQLALNTPGAYALIPSEKYFETTQFPIIHFDSSLEDFAGLINGYGDTIFTYSGLKDFILSMNDDRDIPDISAVSAPAIGNEFIYNKVDNFHQVIDNYVIPSYINTYEISGTGLQTLAGIIYKKSKLCLFKACPDNSFIVSEPVTTVDGDGTVMNASSSILNGYHYLVDMNAYNRVNNVNLDHAYMFENSSIRKLVENIVTNGDLALPHVIDKSTKLPIKSKVIAIHSPVDIDLYDTEGRHTGKCIENPYPEMDCVDAEIPNSSYNAYGEDKYITLPDEGEYTLKLDGYDTGTFTLNIDSYNDDTKVGETSFIDVPTNSKMQSVIALNSSLPTEILLDENGDKVLDTKVTNNGEITKIINKNIKIPKVSTGSYAYRYNHQESKMEIDKNPVPKKIVKEKNMKSKNTNNVAVGNREVYNVETTLPKENIKIEFNQTASLGNLSFDIFKYLFKLLFN